MFHENKENRINYRINQAPLTRDEVEKEILNAVGIGDSAHTVQSVETIERDNITYYKKYHATDTPVKIWNHLYGKDTGKFLRYRDAIYDNEKKLSYFPELGTPISKDDRHFQITCKYACQVAQEDLEGIGYRHTDLCNTNKYGDITYYNCSNVREYMGDYFAIDTEKIVPIGSDKIVPIDTKEDYAEIAKLLLGGNKKRKTNKKSKKAKKSKKVKK